VHIYPHRRHEIPRGNKCQSPLDSSRENLDIARDSRARELLARVRARTRAYARSRADCLNPDARTERPTFSLPPFAPLARARLLNERPQRMNILSSPIHCVPPFWPLGLSYSARSHAAGFVAMGFSACARPASASDAPHSHSDPTRSYVVAEFISSLRSSQPGHNAMLGNSSHLTPPHRVRRLRR
jgi:hypothetical protein